MKKYKTLLWDVDGTLLDFHKAEEEALKRTFASHNIPLTKKTRDIYENLNSHLWKQFEEGIIDKKTLVYTRFGLLFKEIGINEDGVAFEDEYQDELGKGYFLLPYAKEILEILSQQYDLYVVTNGVSKTQYSRLKGTGIDIYFQDIFVSEDTGYQKPMKEYFDYCFQRIKDFHHEDTLIIGDSLTSDILGGYHAHIDTCWINPQHLPCPQDLPITYIISHLKDLENILL